MTDQSVSKSENVTQVGGNVQIVHNHGVSLSELKEVVNILMREHMPALKAEAAATARANAEEFCKTFEERLAPQIPHIDPKNFADPDIQSSIHDAVLNSAKRGENAHGELLADTLISRLRESPQSYPSLVCAEAIKIIPALTQKQISFLTLAVFLLTTKINSATSLAHIAPFAQTIFDLCEKDYKILENEKGYLQYKGCISVNQFSGAKYIDILRSNYSFLAEDTESTAGGEWYGVFSVFQKLNQIFDEMNMGQISLTPVGMVIGVTNMARSVSGIDYRNWLNQ